MSWEFKLENPFIKYSKMYFNYHMNTRAASFYTHAQKITCFRMQHVQWMVQMETSAYWHPPTMDIYLRKNVKLMPESKVSISESTFLYNCVTQELWRRFTRAGRGAGQGRRSRPRCTARCRGSRPPPAGPGWSLTTQTPCVFINMFGGLFIGKFKLSITNSLLIVHYLVTFSNNFTLSLPYLKEINRSD